MKTYDNNEAPYLDSEKKQLESLKQKMQERSQVDYSNDPRLVELYQRNDYAPE